MAGRVGFGIVLLLACSYGLRFVTGAGGRCDLPADRGPRSVTAGPEVLAQLEALGYVGGHEDLLDDASLAALTDGDAEMFAALEAVRLSRSSGRTAPVDAAALRRFEQLGYHGDDEVEAPEPWDRVRIGIWLWARSLR